MDYLWHSGAWIDVLNFPVPPDIPEPEGNKFRLQLEEYVDRCAMVLEDWESREAKNLGEFSWGWVDYEGQLAYLGLEVEGYPDLRLFVWVNDFALAAVKTIHILAANEGGQTYLNGNGMNIILQPRDDVIAQLQRAKS